MAIFIGRDMLLDQLNQTSNRNTNELKGLRGEFEVGDLLAKHLPEDTFVISQPMIGKYEPDILVISPRYGFRIIEVKNWSFNSIKNVHSNGVFTILNKTDNPLQQVRKHVDDLRGYLVSNHPHLIDPYKLIGYSVIHYGFNREDMEKFVKTWDERNAKDFLKFHLFKDDLNSQLDTRLALAAKFRNDGMQVRWIEDIVTNIRNSQSKLTESDITHLIRSDEMDRTAKEIRELANQTKQMVIEQKQQNNNANVVKPTRQKVNNKPNPNAKRALFELLFIVVSIAAVAIFFVSYSGSDDDAPMLSNKYEETEMEYYAEVVEPGAYTNSDIQEAFLSKDNYVRVDANVLSFRFDNTSGTKFLELEVGDYIFDAVVSSDIEIPYLNVDEEYRFYGITNDYNGSLELDITSIKEQK
ncbi:NERD domain-containing protein [Paenisporosarcina macmurdoensis]|uniref:NERD domain-containing protein n=1 Tax=Paenisporosarcina macmurdoensis TaxID=212659 RepID=A0ABW1LB59_9BACL